MSDGGALLATLRELEMRLHQPQVRSDAKQLDRLLHPSFTEHGRSGRRYTKTEILAELTAEEPGGRVWSQDYAVEEVADGLALLTYRSAQVGADGELERHTLRASLWQRSAAGWQVRFHQGTPTGAFPKEAAPC